MADVEMKRVKELMSKKDEIEKEIKEFQEILNSVRNYNCLVFRVDEIKAILLCFSKKKLEWTVISLTTKAILAMTLMYTRSE